MLRAIGKYLRQAGTTFSDRYVEQALVAHPEIARLLVALFQARFDPRRTDREDAEEVAERDRARRSTPSRASTRTGSCASSWR